MSPNGDSERASAGLSRDRWAFKVLRSFAMTASRNSMKTDLLWWAGLLLILVMIAMAIGTVLSRYQVVGWIHYVLLTAVGGCYAVVLLAGKLLLVRRYEARTTAEWQRLLLWLIVFLITVIAGTELAARSMALFGSEVDENRANFLPVGFALTAAAVAIDYGYEQLKRRAREHELREERLRREALRAELSALQARTDPHFLFNALNTLAGLIEEDPAKAAQMLDSLAGLFRYALDGSKSRLVSVTDELRAVETYLQIESLRFGERLSWHVEAAPEAGPMRVPPLFLQPLVENAIVHGVAQKPGRGRVDVRLTMRDALHVEVEDDGPGPGASRVSGSGDALENLRERIDLLFHGAASLRIGSGAHGGCRVSIDIPLVAEPTE